MSEVSRRAFLIRGTMGTAVVGTVAAFPGLAGILTAGEEDASETDAASTSAGADAASATVGADNAGQLDNPLIAHVKDLESGEMSLYMGDQEFTMRDPGLAARLFGGTK